MRTLFCFLTLLLLVGCSSTSLTPINSGSDPTWLGEEQYEVLVAIRLYNPAMRMMFENQMVDALKKQGVNAVPSFSVLPQLSSLNALTFARFLDASPKLAVLFAQATTVNKEQTNSNQEEDSLFADLLGGGEWDATFIARMESALYVHGQIDAVWWNRVSLEAQENKVKHVAERYIRNEIKAMQQGGALERLK